MSRPVFILVPSFDPTGPVKGAFALANALAERFSVRLVALKDYSGDGLPALDEGILLHSLASEKSLLSKLRAYRGLLYEAQRSSGNHPTSISLCFSADVLNAACSDRARTIASVRSNLLKDYRMGFGLPGLPLARFHYLLLNRFDRVIAMTHAMANEVGRFVSREPVVIGNFVDEEFLERYRTASQVGPYRFLFLGSLTERKQPILVVRALAKLIEQGVDATLDLIGGGPLRGALETEIAKRKLTQRVRVHGHLSDPYRLLAAADVMVLPSLSEGLARAGLESLYLGVPCVLRDVDGNAELISDDVNGALFSTEDDLPHSMLRAAQLSRNLDEKVCLLPEAFRKAYAESSFMQLIDGK